MSVAQHPVVPPPHFFGGNSLEKAAPSAVADFVRNHGGHSVVTKVLISNNGIAAVKEIRSVRKWAYETFGNERAIQFTVMATPEDLRVNADYIRMADQCIEVPGGPNHNNYANVDLIVDVAERAGVHAVWAGWGHASENPRLPEALASSKHKILFIGPPGSAMRSLGDKISSTIVAQHADVPCMPWSGSGVRETVVGEEGYITVADHVYRRTCVESAEAGLVCAQQIGFPVMIKASEGGGGKGIRMCEHAEDFVRLYNAAMGEVPGSPIFVMKLAGKARHLEVQLLADQYGNAISLFGRDCSVQRRHQKIIEEAPVTVAPESARREMEEAAVRLAKLVGYVNAGTVEWLYQPETGEFAFLELNPRLQVEHPTTEMVSGVNIPAAQLQIAMGLPLHRIGEIRALYGLAPEGTTPIDFSFRDPVLSAVQVPPRPHGHVIACRITAENPDTGFKPGIGTLTELNFRSSTKTWGYFSVGSSGALHEYADSQFGHVFAYGEDREEARKNMVFSLKELSIRGDFRTTVEYLIKLLEMDAFVQNVITTAWLDGLIQQRVSAARPPSELAVICGAAVKAHQLAREGEEEYKRILHRGQVPPRGTIRIEFPIEFIYENVKYRPTATRYAASGWALNLNGGRTLLNVRPLTDGGLLIGLAGQTHTVYWREEVGMTRLQVDGRTCLIEDENDPSQIRSPSPGKLVRLLVDSGERVRGGQTIAEIEVMKMYLPLVAAESGVVSFVKSAGVSLSPGDLLGVLQLDDPGKVPRAVPFDGRLPDYGPPEIIGTSASQRFAYARQVLLDVLDGYDQSFQLDEALHEFVSLLCSPELPYSQFLQVLSSVSGRLPSRLEDAIRTELDNARARQAAFPAEQLHATIDAFLAQLPSPAARSTMLDTLSGPLGVVVAYQGGTAVHEAEEFCALLQRYYDVEQLFSGAADAVLELRSLTDGDLSRVVELQISHSGVERKNRLLLALLDPHIRTLDAISTTDSAQRMVRAVRDLTTLQGARVAPVSLKAREVLLSAELPSVSERRAQLEEILRQALTPPNGEQGAAGTVTPTLPSLHRLREESDTPSNVFDLLHTFFGHPHLPLAYAALITYVLRAYRAYELVSFNFATEPVDEGGLERRALVTWHFQMSPDVLARGKDQERQASITDLSDYMRARTRPKLRLGAMTSVPRLAALPTMLQNSLKYFGEKPGEPVNTLYVAVTDEDLAMDAGVLQFIGDTVDAARAALNKAQLRRVTVLLSQQGLYPLFATFRRLENGTWEEQRAIQNVEPALAYQLELDRLTCNFELTPVPISSSTLHLYYAHALKNRSDCRFFVRAFVRPGRLQHDVPMYLMSECERTVNDILNMLEVSFGRPEFAAADASHVFISFLYPMRLKREEVRPGVEEFMQRHGAQMARLRMTEIELRLVLEDEDRVQAVRLFVANETPFAPLYEEYEELLTPDGTTVLSALPPTTHEAPRHMKSAHAAYPVKYALQARRSRAHALGTTFVYDLVQVLRHALRKFWADVPNAPDDPLLEVRELEPAGETGEEVQEVQRAPAQNRIGMVAWQLLIATPEYPAGRPLVLIANDVTFQAGSFGPAEDRFFAAVSRMARAAGIPKLYVSSNSGARIGLATEPMDLFRVKFVRDDPCKGFEYLYLDDAGLRQLEETAPGAVQTTPFRTVDGGVHHVITAIVGTSQNGLGVECLSGSGLIAGEMSRSRQSIFTTTIVSGRSVGIGAYLARLGGRVIQVCNSPMILTGYQALNKLLGREVYTSNLQLGGPQIMHRNGVSHLAVPNDMDAVTAYLRWLSYVPATAGAPLCITTPRDPWDRDVEFTPSQSAYDPRFLITGTVADDGSYQPGLFDRDSFQETLSGWASSVVVGRARLGGVPFGVIAVETRTLERVVPADPANPNSNELRIAEAGQVWYPNSAYKTAQAIMDFNAEGLPLMILANWRGFSGGQQDMYDEILKQGSKIVDGLSSYRQPVFVYIPPAGELRGGSWVVIDSAVNNNGLIEMSADAQSARGGVLEASGAVEIKFRADKQRATMERLDPTYAQLSRAAREAPAAQRSMHLARLAERERQLSPFFLAVATEYADAHDRAGRMLATGVLRCALAWKDTRRYFYWRSRRRLAETSAQHELVAADPSMSMRASLAVVQQAAGYAATDSDQQAVRQLEASAESISDAVQRARVAQLARQLQALDPSLRSQLLASCEN